MPTLDFKGKNYVYSHHLSVPFRDLKIDEKKSKPAKGQKPNMDDNLIIQGDNLHALKALLPKYAGKIKCIYIDPPYNTGNEGWCYNDKVNSPLIREWLKDNANPVDKDDLERHDKWLCMMWPRLQLLRELLSDDGVIFISIDDNEVHHLRALMDEIFGEKNFISELPWRGRSGGADDKFLMQSHEYVLIYSKRKEFYNVGKKIKELGNYPKFDEIKRQKYATQLLRKWGSNSRQEDRPNLYYPIPTPDGGELFPILPDGNNGCWRWQKTRMLKAIEEGFVEFVEKDGKIIAYEKIFEPSGNNLPTKLYSTWIDEDIKNYIDESIDESEKLPKASMGSRLLNDLFGKKVFDYPKPYELIKILINISNAKQNDIILDSFAGSGTTAHATLALNKEDGGNRKFILVEMEDYANDITAERVRCVIDGVPNAKDENLKNGLGGSFTYCELGDEFDVEKILTGESLPSYSALASYVFYTVTGQSLDKEVKANTNYFVGESDLYDVYMIYKDDISFLRSNDSALNQEKLDIIAAHNPKSTKQKVVFATAKYMSQEALKAHNIVFCQIPYAIHKIAGN